MELMDKEMYIDSSNSWVAPLPFRIPRQRLPNNRELKHLMTLHQKLRRKTQMQEHFVTFMHRVFDTGHAKLAPPVKENREVLYLLIFGVYPPCNLGQIKQSFLTLVPSTKIFR